MSPSGPQYWSAATTLRQPIELFRGTLTDAAFQATEANLTKSIRARSNAKPHIAGLMPASTLAIEPVPPTGVVPPIAYYAFPLYGRKRRLSEQVGTLYFGLGAAEDRSRLVCATVVLTASVRLMANALTVEASASRSLLLRSLAR